MLIRAVCLLLSLFLIAAGPATSPATLPATRPATQPGLIPELAEAMARIQHLVPAEVLQGKRPPNDRERVVASMVKTLTLSGMGRDGFGQTRRLIAQAQAASDARFAELRKRFPNPTPALKDELETVQRLTRELLHVHDFLDVPTTFPSQREAQLDLARRFDQIPAAMATLDRINRDLPYHDRRLNLLLEIEQRLPLAEGTDDTAKTARKEIDDRRAQISALDQVQRDKPNPATGPTSQPTAQP